VNRKKNLLAVVVSLAVLAAVNLYTFRDHWRGLSSFTFDFPMAYYAFTSYWIASLQMGEWPHWIPYQSMGYPAALNPQLGMFYPPFWAFVLFRLPYTLHAANVVQVLHVLFGSMGFFFFARRSFRLPVALCGAVCFGLFGGFYTNAEHPDIVRAFSWTPWLLWALLLDENPVERRIGAWRIVTRLRTATLCLPAIIYCFLTGAYPGLMVSGLFMAGVFILSQAAGMFWSRRDRTAIRDGLAQGVLVALGIGMALVYLLPTAYLSGSLTRAHTYATFGQAYLRTSDLYHLFLPSSLVTAEDYSMRGMQLPLVMLLFVPLARARKGLAAPVAAMAAVAGVMSFQVLRPVSSILARIVPVFRLSRFPAGDYRIFFCLALLLAALAGLEFVLRSREAAWRNAAILLATLTAVLAPSIYLIATPIPAVGKQILPLLLALEALGCLLAIAGWLFFAHSRWSNTVWVWILTAGCIAVSIPTLRLMKDFWSDPHIEAYLYDQQGLLLTGPDRRLRVENLFFTRHSRRPARVDEPAPRTGMFGIMWRGYIEGAYMTRDLGGAQPIGLQTVAGNPSLAMVMRQPGELLEVDCNPQVCDAGDSDGVTLPGRPLAGKSFEYSRNYVVYEADVPARSLVVENEMYAPGWSGYCETHGERLVPKRIDGALRGWVLEGGKHRLRIVYRTPWLAPGAILSALFGVCWVGTVAAWWRGAATSPRTNSPDSAPAPS
jgi:hypothetical protein